MATVKVCDRCKYPINPKSSGTIISIGGLPDSYYNQHYELCCSCAYQLKNFLNTKKDNDYERWNQ